MVEELHRGPCVVKIEEDETITNKVLFKWNMPPCLTQHMWTPKVNMKVGEEDGTPKEGRVSKKTTKTNWNFGFVASSLPNHIQQLTTYIGNFDYDNYGKMFVMRYKENSMTGSTSTSASIPKDIWSVDLSMCAWNLYY